MTKRFASCFAADLDAFLEYKHALGHPYERAVWTLRSFDRCASKTVGDSGRRAGLPEIIAGWLASRRPARPVSIATELGVIRQFCLFRRRHDPGGFVPGREWAPQSTESDFAPYVFSPKQVLALLAAARRVRAPAFRGVTLRLILLVLYCTGLRPGEAVRLRLGDLDMERRVLSIRMSKGRARLVPFRRDLSNELRRYLMQRRMHALRPGVDAVFLRPDGHPMSAANLSGMVRGILRRMGLKRERGHRGPRCYDLRHAFAVHRLTRWHRSGLDVHGRLPWLSAYMGHVDILGTEIYLTATPELLALASKRFARLVGATQR